MAEEGERIGLTVERPAFALARDASDDLLLASLAENGVVMLRSYLDGATVMRLRAEVSNLAYRDHEHQLIQEQSRLGRYRLTELEALEMSTVLTVGMDARMRRIADIFFEPHLAEFHKVYCHHDVAVMAFNNAWHYDRGLTLKFFYYLNDVTRENGAFWYDLGSHRHNAVKQHLGWEARMPSLNYIPGNEVSLPVPFEGPSGSLIIFDASGFHQAGEIVNGGERWIVRFHVAAGERYDGVQSALNPYARRNWEFRSRCYSQRDDEAKAPWASQIAKVRAKPADATKGANHSLPPSSVPLPPKQPGRRFLVGEFMKRLRKAPK